ncbi:hypothetical protein ALC56_12000 [Trachymyrmex septentrionalis]|uniref:Uncharacterized protein n=1 Tax=Trachymyrmex septentrionalis TaxID=34720 RepID=A0A195F0Q9_9HYME|nr:hypothetical protein ALC56_12000 [Trachymyrmex septentrionalis]
MEKFSFYDSNRSLRVDALRMQNTNRHCAYLTLPLFKSQMHAVLTRYKLPRMEKELHSRYCTTSDLNPRGIGERRGKLTPKLSAENHELAN